MKLPPWDYDADGYTLVDTEQQLYWSGFDQLQCGRYIAARIQAEEILWPNGHSLDDRWMIVKGKPL